MTKINRNSPFPAVAYKRGHGMWARSHVYNRLSFNNIPGLVRVERYSGDPIFSISELQKRLGVTNTVLVVPADKLPFSDLVPVMHSMKIAGSLYKLAKGIAFCTHIKDHTESREGVELDAFVANYHNRMVLHNLRDESLYEMIFLRVKRDKGQFISTVELGGSIAHELGHLEIWDAIKNRQYSNREIPSELTDIYCVLKERQAMINMLTAIGQHNSDDLSYIEKNISAAVLTQNIRLLNNELIEKYKWINTTKLAGMDIYGLSGDFISSIVSNPLQCVEISKEELLNSYFIIKECL